MRGPIKSSLYDSLSRNRAISSLFRSAKSFVFRNKRLRELSRMGYHTASGRFPILRSKLKLDIVIPSIEKDLATLPYVIDYARANVMHPIGNIYIISPDSEKIKQVCTDKKCVFVLEDALIPINKPEIDYRVGKLDRSGWLYQQFLKLSGEIFCSQDNYLVIDSDTLLISQQVFERDGKFIYNFSDEYHSPYFDVYERLFGYPVRCPVSFTSHHILVNVNMLRRMKIAIEARNGLPWYQSIINAIDKSETSGHSDYDTYGQYALESMSDLVCLEYWHNISLPRQSIVDIDSLSIKYEKSFKSISFHSWNAGKSL